MKHIMITLLLTLFAITLFAQEKTMKTYNIYSLILLGPPLAGKGTLASSLATELDLEHVSTGDIFRSHMKKDTPLGIKAKGFIDAGNLVPDDLVMDMVFDKISTDTGNRRYLLDGFPRTVGQAKAFRERLGVDSTVIVIQMIADDDSIVDRASNRLSCPQCGKTYSKIVPPKVKDICDVCKTELIQRPDDRPEIVRERLRVYHKQTQPLIVFYKEKGFLRSINALQDPGNVYSDTIKVLRD